MNREKNCGRTGDLFRKKSIRIGEESGQRGTNTKFHLMSVFN